MSVDQTFHTPSFGDEEFDIPSLNCNSRSYTTGRYCGQSIFGNQVPVEYLKRKLNCDQIYVYLPGREENLGDCQIYNNHHSLSNQRVQESLLSSQNYILNSGSSQNIDMNSNLQFHPTHPQRDIYQNEMMAQHSMNIQQMQAFDNHSTYFNASPQQTSMQPPQMMMQQNQIMGPPQQQQQTFSTISQSQISSHLGLQVGMAPVPQHQGAGSMGSSPPGSNHNSPGLETSEDSDDSTPLAQLIGTMKRPTPEPVDTAAPKTPKKPKSQKKKKKRDPNEPQKPVSAYALFFRDTQAAIKGQNPNASFGEVSKIVASMWDSLDVDHKNSYKKKTETAKKEYLKALAAYRATLVSKAAVDQSDAIYGNSGMNSSPPMNSSPSNSPPSRMMQKSSPVLTSVVDSMQPVTNTVGVHAQQGMQNQQAWHMQSPPHMTNSNSPPHMMQNNGMMNMHQQAMQPQMVVMNNRPPMSATSPQMCNSASNSPSYAQNSTAAPSGGSFSNMSGGDTATCIRDGCSNPAINSPDWDREYCSSECVVSHCKDVFATWVAQRQAIPNPYSAVK